VDKSKGGPKNQRSIKQLPQVKEREKSAKEREKSAKKKADGKNDSKHGTNMSFSIDSDDEFEFKKKPLKIIKKDNFRPPQVWNFPVEKIKSKDDDPKTIQIRVVDPRNHYIDGRIVNFLNLFQKMKDRMLYYSRSAKGDSWKYYTEKILVIFSASNVNIINEKD